MSLTSLRLGWKVVGLRSPSGLLSSKGKVFEISAACISGKSFQLEKYEKPKPWAYKEKGYNTFHAYIDGTLKRIDDNSKVIVVEGLPGIGKTELAKALAEELEMKHFPMTTMEDYYINSYGYDLRQLDHLLPPNLKSYDISKFLQNPKSQQAAFFQYSMFRLKFMQYIDALAHVLNTGEGVVLERSVYSDIVFTETMHKTGYLTKKDLAGYIDYRDTMFVDLMKPHLVIYLDVPPAVAEENLKKRGKGEEKIFNREFLELLDYNYKQGHLKSISEHAELLVYDWTVPGESEIVVEDIERIDFDKFEIDIHDPKMSDWRLKTDWDWSEKRWEFTNNRQQQYNRLMNYYVPDVPGILMSGDEAKIMEQFVSQAPGMQYDVGYNADMGDTGILFKTKDVQYRPDVKKA